MQLRIYNSDLTFQGIIENQTSIIWTRRYFEPGDFTITMPLTDENIRLCQLENLVSKRNSAEAGVIENLQIKESYNERTIVISGRFLSSYMDRRLIKGRYNFSGYVEVAMRTILSNATTLPNVELGTLQGYTDEVEFQATYKNLLAYETKLAKSVGYGFIFRPDFAEKKIYFEVYKGLDKTRNQTDRAFVEFSDKFDNLEQSEARINNQLYKNVGYVGGQGEGDDRVYTQVGNHSLTGLERREVFIDARDMAEEDVGTKPTEPIFVRPNESDYLDQRTATISEGNTISYSYFYETNFNNALSQAESTYQAAMSQYQTDLVAWQAEKARVRSEYIIALQTRGNQKLEEYLLSNSIDCDVIPMGNFKYKTDYDLGDVVSVRKTNWDYETTARITEITEVYEHEEFTVTPVLGDALPEVINWEDK